jgi:hypothetical protein
VVIVKPDRVEARNTTLILGKEFTMTDATVALAELAEKGSDVNLLRQMVQFMAQCMMDMDVDGVVGTARLGSDRPSSVAARTWPPTTAKQVWQLQPPSDCQPTHLA